MIKLTCIIPFIFSVQTWAATSSAISENIDQSSKVTLELSNEGLGRAIQTKIDGVERLCFLDMGSYYSAIRADEFSQKYEKIGSISSVVASGSRMEMDIVSIQNLQIAGLNLHQVKMARSQLNGLQEDCVIGSDILRKANQVIFDFPQNILKFGSPSSDLIKNKYVFSTHERSSTPIIDLTIYSIKMKAFWDTGADQTIISERIVKANPTLFLKLPQNESAIGAAGNTVRVDAYFVGEINIGDLHLNKQIIWSSNLPDGMDAILGMDLISNYKWFFDYSTSTWSLL